MLPCRYTPFRSDDVKELVRHTTGARVNFHDRYWKNIMDKGMPGAIISRISADGNPLQCRWVLAPHSKELHSWSAQFRPCALSHRGASACSFFAYEVRGPDGTRSLRSAREL